MIIYYCIIIDKKNLNVLFVIAHGVRRPTNQRREEPVIEHLQQISKRNGHEPYVVPHDPSNRSQHFFRQLVRSHGELLEKRQRVQLVRFIVKVARHRTRVHGADVDASRFHLARHVGSKRGNVRFRGPIQS